MQTIVQASIRTGRPPLVAPDYFLEQFSSGELLGRLFGTRESMPGVHWELFTETNEIEKHKDYPAFVQHVKTKVILGEWLFEPSVWNKQWFARMTIEMGRYEFRQEIIDMVTSEGYHINLPAARKAWNRQEKEIIREVAWKYWIEWRKDAESKFEGMATHTSQNCVGP
jgi:hypothetical protein